MTRATVNAICQTLRGASVFDAGGGGHDTSNAGGQIFASIGTGGDDMPVNGATINDALHLEDLFGCPKVRCLHRSWVDIPQDTNADEHHHRIAPPYSIPRASMAQTGLAPID